MPAAPSVDPALADAVTLVNPDGRGDLVLACEHASNHIPEAFGDLGLDAAQRRSHIAWDPGALAVARLLSARLDAPLVASAISRLVYDCNRADGAPDAVPDRSELTDIPGNRNLSAEAIRARRDLAYGPFRAALEACLDARADRGVPLVTVHSFTPVYKGRERDLDIGILHDADARLADRLLAAAARRTDLRVRRNAPYGPEDGVTHTLQAQAVSRGLPNAMFEIRNDLIADAAGQRALADLLADLITEARTDLLAHQE